jgi:hypothetical protein
MTAFVMSFLLLLFGAHSTSDRSTLGFAHPIRPACNASIQPLCD